MILRCDGCGTVYVDEESLAMAEAFKGDWEKICKRDGVEPRGLMPCPIIGCEGQLILEEG